MARLTRTQKYAEYRDKIANDREESFKTSDLKPFEEKLKNLESFFNDGAESVLDKKNEPTPIAPVSPITDTIKVTEVIENNKDDSKKELNSLIDTIFPETAQEQKEVKEEEEPKEELKEIKTTSAWDDLFGDNDDNSNPLDLFDKKEEPIHNLSETLEEQNVNKEVEEETSDVDFAKEEKSNEEIRIENLEAAVQENPKEEVEEAAKPHAVVKGPTSGMELLDIVNDEVKELSGIIDINNGPCRQIEEKQEEKVEVAPNNGEITNNFIDQTLNEVDNYNRKEGRTTIDNLTENIVDEVRHPQNTVQGNIDATKSFNPNEIKKDDDFSNTVSLEVEKVLNEINNQKDVVTPELTPKAVIANNEEIEEQAKAAFENAEVKEEKFEHPALAKTQEGPVVEIKNLNDTFTGSLEDTNALDDTIPFNIDKQDDEGDIEEELEESETPSKVLNVILGILIFVLVAVLGVIVYYILVAKGIIG